MDAPVVLAHETRHEDELGCMAACGSGSLCAGLSLLARPGRRGLLPKMPFPFADRTLVSGMRIDQGALRLSARRLSGCGADEPSAIRGRPCSCGVRVRDKACRCPKGSGQSAVDVMSAVLDSAQHSLSAVHAACAAMIGLLQFRVEASKPQAVATDTSCSAV